MFHGHGFLECRFYYLLTGLSSLIVCRIINNTLYVRVLRSTLSRSEPSLRTLTRLDLPLRLQSVSPILRHKILPVSRPFGSRKLLVSSLSCSLEIRTQILCYQRTEGQVTIKSYDGHITVQTLLSRVCSYENVSFFSSNVPSTIRSHL